MASLKDIVATRDRAFDFSAFNMVLPNPDPVLKRMGKDIEVYRDLRSDAHVGGCIRRRKAAVRAMESGLDRKKAKSRIAKNIEAIFADLDMDSIVAEALDGMLYGYQPMEIMWGRVGSMVVPTGVIGKPPEWFLFNPQNELRFRTREKPWEGEELPARKFLLPRQDPSYQNPYGFPDLSMCFWPTTFKKGGLKFWVNFCEKFGMPWIIGKEPRGTLPAETDNFLDRLAEMVQDAVAVIPDDSTVEILESKGNTGSGELYERMLMFCRSEVSIALLGQNQTTEKDSTHASAKAGHEVTRDIRDGDARVVSASINQLIEWTVELNWGAVERPVWSMWEQEQVDKVQAERDAMLTRAGLRLTPAYFKKAYNLEDEDIAPPEPTDKPASGLEVSRVEDFAEGETPVFPDQVALDTAANGLSGEALAAQLESMLRPAVEALLAGGDEDAAASALLASYPQLDDSTLVELLGRALFVAETWGRLSAGAENAQTA
ncbi:MAG: hypothetical protein JWL63_3216 [Rhodocyclales bacterium]|nr:hypothetical protein [Rhodocyclales bacterium]